MNQAPKNNIKAVVFDLGNVVVRVNFERFLKAFGLHSKLKQKWVFLKLFRTGIFPKLERGEMTFPEFIQVASHQLNIKDAHQDFNSKWNSVFDGTVEGVDAILKELKNKVNIYALTNINEIHFEYMLKNFSELSHFESIFASHLMGARKPEKEAYEHVTKNISHKPSQILFLDDMEENIQSARELGWNAELCANSSQRILEILRKYQVG